MKQSMFWNGVASNYRCSQWENSQVARFDYNMTRDALMEQLDPQQAESILEVGCGPGTWTKIISPKCHKLVAVDLSISMLEEAKRFCSGQKNISFVHSDIMNLELKEKFDKIFSVRSFEYVTDKKSLLMKLSFLLKNNGKLVIITKSKPCLWGLAKKSPGFSQEKISMVEMKKLLKDSGFGKINYCPAIVRLPIFESGNREFPLIKRSFEEKFLKFFSGISKKARKTNVVFKKMSMFFSESYLISAQKEA